MKYITDNEGNKYELSYQPNLVGGAYILKPIAPVVEDKPTVELEHIDQQGTAPGGTHTGVINIESKVWTPTQTEAVATAIRQMLEYINTTAGRPHKFSPLDAIEKARIAVQGDSHE